MRRILAVIQSRGLLLVTYASATRNEPNVVYLYRVIARLNGEELDNYETGADAYFNDYQIGKMYLMR